MTTNTLTFTTATLQNCDASHFKVFVTRQLIGQVDSLVSSPLRHHNDASDLLHLRVVWWTGAIQVSSNLEGKKSITEENLRC